MERCQADFEKTRHGHVWGQISRKVVLDQAWANCRSQIFLIQKNLSKLKGVIYLW